MARLLKARGYEIVTAFNADKSGDRMADRMRELVGSGVRRDRPPGDRGKDWNEQLKSLRAEHGAGREQVGFHTVGRRVRRWEPEPVR